MEGWRPVDHPARWAFAQAPVVTANEAHNGLARCWREREQAANLGRLLDAAPGEPLLVWCGNSHASKVEHEEWIPMRWHFRDMSGVDALVVSTDNEMTA